MCSTSLILFHLVVLLSASRYSLFPNSCHGNSINPDDLNLVQPKYPTFITTDLLGLIEITEVEGFFYMSTDKHLSDFPAELNLPTLMLESFKGNYGNFRRFFIPFLVAEYLIPLWRQQGVLTSAGRNFMAKVSREYSSEFSRYMQHLFWAVFIITGRISMKSSATLEKLNRLLCKDLRFEWRFLFDLTPRSNLYASYTPNSLANIIRVAHQWGLNVGKIVAKFPQDSAVLEYLQDNRNFVDDAVTARTVIRSMSGPSGYKPIIMKSVNMNSKTSIIDLREVFDCPAEQVRVENLSSSLVEIDLSSPNMNALLPQPLFSSDNSGNVNPSIGDFREPSSRPSKRSRIENLSPSPVQQNLSSQSANTIDNLSDKSINNGSFGNIMKPSNRAAKRPRGESPSSSPIRRNSSSTKSITSSSFSTLAASSSNGNNSAHNLSIIKPAQPASVVRSQAFSNTNDMILSRRRLIAQAYFDFLTIYNEDFIPDDRTAETAPFLEENHYGMPPFYSLQS